MFFRHERAAAATEVSMEKNSVVMVGVASWPPTGEWV